METNVWQLFAKVVASALNLFASSSAGRNLLNGGVSQNVPASDAASILTSKSATTLAVTRDPKMETTDALFGVMDYNGERIGYSMERTAVAIPEGTYRGYKRDSVHLGMRVVGIDVPNRTDIECHPANLPSQVKGCVAVGSEIDNDALDNSKAAFDKMMSAVPEEFTVVVSSV